MTATGCSCGFTDLADESLTDHLERVFTPEDAIGQDGRVHEEGDNLTCSCGAATATSAQMDQHFLAAFTPSSRTGSDGQRHEPISAD
jgi:hypothetical protein